MIDDYEKMRVALREAELAAALGETPVGAAIFRGDALIAFACNRRETKKNALLHAEILAIDKACRVLGGWRLQECDLYVTLEPCPMCAGAAINARIRRIVFGARDPKAGCLGSVCDLPALPFNHKPEVTGGVREEECGALLTAFFRELRRQRRGG